MAEVEDEGVAQRLGAREEGLGAELLEEPVRDVEGGLEGFLEIGALLAALGDLRAVSRRNRHRPGERSKQKNALTSAKFGRRLPML